MSNRLVCFYYVLAIAYKMARNVDILYLGVMSEVNLHLAWLIDLNV